MNGSKSAEDFKVSFIVVKQDSHFEKLKVKELDFYLKEYGPTNIGRKLDKAGKSYTMSLLPTHKLESVNTDESCGTNDESDGESGDEEYEEEFGSEEDESGNDFFFNNLDEKSNPSQTMQSISDDQICKVVVQGS